MRQIICDGCKKGEELKGDAKAGKDIKQIELEIWEDERSSVPRVPKRADLCGSCRQEMLNKYFRATVDTTEALIEPESLKADFVPADEQIVAVDTSKTIAELQAETEETHVAT